MRFNKSDYRQIKMGRTYHSDSSLVSTVVTVLTMSAVQLLAFFLLAVHFIGSSGSFKDSSEAGSHCWELKLWGNIGKINKLLLNVAS